MAKKKKTKNHKSKSKKWNDSSIDYDFTDPILKGMFGKIKYTMPPLIVKINRPLLDDTFIIDFLPPDFDLDNNQIIPPGNVKKEYHKPYDIMSAMLELLDMTIYNNYVFTSDQISGKSYTYDFTPTVFGVKIDDFLIEGLYDKFMESVNNLSPNNVSNCGKKIYCDIFNMYAIMYQKIEVINDITYIDFYIEEHFNIYFKNIPKYYPFLFRIKARYNTTYQIYEPYTVDIVYYVLVGIVSPDVIQKYEQQLDTPPQIPEDDPDDEGPVTWTNIWEMD
jgi:hypothetical protein